jgi:drug/metabolite transporter (DMT)-like permease
MIIGFLGVLLIMLNDNLQFSSTTIIGDLLTLLAFFIWSLYIVFNRKISIKENPQFVTLSVFIWVCFLLVPLSFGFGMVEQIKLLSILDWSVIAYLGIICSGVATLFYTIALSNEEIPSENLVLIGFLIPVIGIFTSSLVLDEEINWRIIVGCIIVIISVFIIELNKKKEKLVAFDQI